MRTIHRDLNISYNSARTRVKFVPLHPTRAYRSVMKFPNGVNRRFVGDTQFSVIPMLLSSVVKGPRRFNGSITQTASGPRETSPKDAPSWRVDRLTPSGSSPRGAQPAKPSKNGLTEAPFSSRVSSFAVYPRRVNQLSGSFSLESLLNVSAITEMQLHVRTIK